MSSDPQHPDMRHLWQGQLVEDTSMSLDALRNALAKLKVVERRRTWVGALFCMLFVAAFGTLVITASPNRIVRAVECVFAMGAGFFLRQSVLGFRKARGKWLSQGEPQACAVFYRSVLERQRDSYRRAALWVPILISATLLPVILWLPPLRLIMIVLWVVLVLFWVYEGLETARRSQRELDQLNASWR